MVTYTTVADPFPEPFETVRNACKWSVDNWAVWWAYAALVAAAAVVCRRAASGRSVDDVRGHGVVRWAFSVMCWSGPMMHVPAVMMHCMAPPNSYDPASLLYLLSVVWTCWAVDWIVSDAPWHNLEVAQGTGYGNPFLWMFVYNDIPIFLLYFAGIPQVHADYSAITVHDDNITLAWHVAATLAAAEAVFTVIHCLMHAYFPSVHVLHHCATRPSWNTGLWFHPVDRLLELFPALITAQVVGGLLLQDTWAGYIAAQIWTMSLWLSHDEQLNLEHTSVHHRNIGAAFTLLPLHLNFIRVPDKVCGLIAMSPRSPRWRDRKERKLDGSKTA